MWLQLAIILFLVGQVFAVTNPTEHLNIIDKEKILLVAVVDGKGFYETKSFEVIADFIVSKGVNVTGLLRAPLDSKSKSIFKNRNLQVYEEGGCGVSLVSLSELQAGPAIGHVYQNSKGRKILFGGSTGQQKDLSLNETTLSTAAKLMFGGKDPDYIQFRPDVAFYYPNHLVGAIKSKGKIYFDSMEVYFVEFEFSSLPKGSHHSSVRSFIQRNFYSVFFTYLLLLMLLLTIFVYKFPYPSNF